MKITEINIPKSSDDGLEAIKMSRLENVVLIAGKNGAGKTRILKKIFDTLAKKPKMSDLEKLDMGLSSYRSEILTWRQSILVLEEQLRSATNDQQEHIIKQQISNYNKNIDNYNKLIEQQETPKKWHLIETDIKSDNYSSVRFVPEKLDLKDSNSYSKAVLLQNAKNADNVGISQMPEGAFAKIQVIQNRWFSATHQKSPFPQEEKKIAVENYEKLKEIISVFFNTSIERNEDDDATIFGFPLGKSLLSDGQKVLLQLCIAIYSQEVALKDMILVLDEPENHLHPSVIIEIIDKIKDCASNGQIWISTHSVPLLAHFNPSLLWYVESGKIRYAGRTPENVLQSLLGNDDEIGNLQNFISLPAQFATSKYAFESLMEPAAVMTNSNDPQSLQIKNELLSLSENGKIRILDYGAGKGRLISNIDDLDTTAKDTLVEKMEYIAFDKCTNDKVTCVSVLERLFKSPDKKYYNDFTALFSDYDKESFDVVVMCNVLHEIDPKDWLGLFQADGEISKCLKPNGVLLLVEDCQMPIGEKAYQKGFLVLDTPQLKDLFNITEKDISCNYFEYCTAKGNDRLKSHRISKNLLTRITTETRTKALRSISSTAKSEILKTRQTETSYANGTLHGFWTQQFANAQLALAEFEGIPHAP